MASGDDAAAIDGLYSSSLFVVVVVVVVVVRRRRSLCWRLHSLSLTADDVVIVVATDNGQRTTDNGHLESNLS